MVSWTGKTVAEKEMKGSKVMNKNDKINIGIMGGTFDPIHYGHLAMAEEVRLKFKLDRIIFIPSGNPPHKMEQNIADKRHRYIMTLLATEANEYFEVSRDEVDRQGYTYTIDTIRNLKKQFKGSANIYFITGADNVTQILNWKEAEQLLKSCEFIMTTRPGFTYDEIVKGVKYLEENYDSKIHLIKVPSFAISSTDIRQRVQNNISIKYLLPESVEQYIYSHKLYRVGEDG